MTTDSHLRFPNTERGKDISQEKKEKEKEKKIKKIKTIVSNDSPFSIEYRSLFSSNRDYFGWEIRGAKKKKKKRDSSKARNRVGYD